MGMEWVSVFIILKTTLEYIEIENNGKTERIPLSMGINVIIGDNSIGKSMLLHALSGFEKTGEELSKPLRDGYKSYLKRKNLKIKKQLKKENVFAFDMQGEVRKKFEENRLVASEFSSYFPSSIDPQPYKTIIYNEINRLISYLESKFKVDNEIKKLSTFNIYIDDGTPESLSFVGKLRNAKGSISNVNSIISAIKQVLVDYSCRIEYIDPLLKILGWDVANEKGLAPQYREVIAENYSTPTDRPDYTMTLRGVAKFFVEAKKPAVDITRVTDSAFQTRKYGWNANHRIAVLTNFEYLAIYDTCYIPKEEDGCAVA